MLTNFDSLFAIEEVAIPDELTTPAPIGGDLVEVTLPESEADGEEFLIRIAR